eukprot:399125_1
MKALRQSNKTLEHSLRARLKGYCNRISPLMQFQSLFAIDDSIEKVANYLVATSQFINNLITKQDTKVPFQVDLSILVKKVESKSQTTEVDLSDEDDEDDEDDDDDDDEKKDDGEGNEIKFGDIAAKLKHEKLTALDKEMDDAKGPEDSARIMMGHFNEFKDELSKSSKGYDANTYPTRKRFNILADRREEKDKMTFFEPPSCCDSLPETNHVPEWYFESVRKCIIPRKGYGDGSKEQDQKEEEKTNDNTTISGQVACAGKIITFSFHVEASDQI